METIWLKQDATQPLYPDLLWSQPGQKSLAGKLVIIGGNTHAIDAPHRAYRAALRSGVGTATVVLPTATRKLLPTGAHVDIEFSDSTPTGSFGQKGLETLYGYIAASDALLLAGDLSRNSETAIVLEHLARLRGQQTYAKDALEYFDTHPLTLYDREDTLLVASISQLQKQFKRLGITPALTLNMGLVRLVELLGHVTSTHAAAILTLYEDTYIAAVSGQIITTPLQHPRPIWRVESAAVASVWLLQNSSTPLQALATASAILAKTP